MTQHGSTPDLVVVGGGVIGLSVAYEALRAGLSVTLLERGQVGREASWAGAGILPPRSWYVDHPVLDWLAERADGLHPRWSEQLREETGLDNEYRRCGSVYRLGENAGVSSQHADAASATLNRWQGIGVAVERSGTDEYRVPAEAQVRNPRHLKALAAACRLRGGRLIEGAEVVSIDQRGGRIQGLQTTRGEVLGGQFCFAAGSWTPALVDGMGVDLGGRPIRGQMLLLRVVDPPATIVHAPPWYAVPRYDGQVLVGATVEEVGFLPGTTQEARTQLLEAAERLYPGLGSSRVEGFWSGLRPCGADELPLIGGLPGVENGWLASAHHRSGLQFAPPTAELIVSMLLGETTPEEVTAFDPARLADLSLQSG